jgi:YVTN family beta-propeller protein
VTGVTERSRYGSSVRWSIRVLVVVVLLGSVGVPSSMAAIVPGPVPNPAGTPESTLVTSQVTQTSLIPNTLVMRQPTLKISLRITPATATVWFTAPDMATVTASAGSTVRVPLGKAELRVEAPGYQSLRQTVVLGASTPVIARRLDPLGQLHRHRWEAQTGSNPKQVAFTPDGLELWVPLLGSRGVDVFRTTDGTKVANIALGNQYGAVEVIFNREGTRAFVSQMQTATVIEIDSKTKRRLRTFKTGGNWTKVMALSPDETTLFAANWVSNDVSVIDLTNGLLDRIIPTVKTPRGLVLDPAGERLFVAGFDGGEIQRITLRNDEKKVLLRTGGAIRHMVVDPLTNRLYADDMGNSLTYVMDLGTEQVRTLAKVDSHPNTIDLSDDGRFLYVSNRGANSPKGYNVPGPEWGSVVVLDVRTGTAVDAIIGGNQTTGLDVSPDGRLVAFTDFLDNRLSLYEVPTASTLDEGAGGLAPTRRRLLRK